MISGFDRYFQIAPCFRDEDARADRSPGEFYQLDLEMAFVEQEDVFQAVEPVMQGVFKEPTHWEVTPLPFPRIAYRDAMVRYGSDKPDLRNPIAIADVGAIFKGGGFAVFARAVEQGAVVRAVPAPGAVGRPRRFFDQMVAYAQSRARPGSATSSMPRARSRRGRSPSSSTPSGSQRSRPRPASATAMRSSSSAISGRRPSGFPD